ncbi:MAG: hypothetical protein FD160_1701 [Caulobacteraceae bacterium]|nr:MAG: hypothetical protein FD160_1701 [Caulobacteraceae bacterium]
MRCRQCVSPCPCAVTESPCPATLPSPRQTPTRPPPCRGRRREMCGDRCGDARGRSHDFPSPACGRGRPERREVRVREQSRRMNSVLRRRPSPGASRHPLPHAGEGIQAAERQACVSPRPATWRHTPGSRPRRHGARTLDGGRHPFQMCVWHAFQVHENRGSSTWRRTVIPTAITSCIGF